MDECRYARWWREKWRQLCSSTMCWSAQWRLHQHTWLGRRAQTHCLCTRAISWPSAWIWQVRAYFALYDAKLHVSTFFPQCIPPSARLGDHRNSPKLSSPRACVVQDCLQCQCLVGLTRMEASAYQSGCKSSGGHSGKLICCTWHMCSSRQQTLRGVVHLNDEINTLD